LTYLTGYFWMGWFNSTESSRWCIWSRCWSDISRFWLLFKHCLANSQSITRRIHQ